MTLLLTQTAEEHVLETFLRHEATTLSMSLLFDESAPFAHADIARALAQLEHGERALLRYSWEGTDWVTLTVRGVARRGDRTASGERRSGRGGAQPRIVYEHPHQLRAAVRDYNAYILGCPRSY